MRGLYKQQEIVYYQLCDYETKLTVLLINQLLQQPSLLAYFVGADNYAWLQFRNGERRLLAKPLLYFEERLPTFVRIHKTALINPRCVTGLNHPPRPKMAGSVQLLDGTELPVSRRRWKEVAQLLQPNDASTDTATLVLDAQPELEQEKEKVSPLRVQVIMSGDRLLLTENCLRELSVPHTLQSTSSGAELPSALLLGSADEWPVLIIIDAQQNRVDSILTLQKLKSHPQLRAIPVIWLAAPGDNMMQAYLLDANSVVTVPEDPTGFVRVCQELLQYWLTIVQLWA